jgi:hypothetical protein
MSLKNMASNLFQVTVSLDLDVSPAYPPENRNAVNISLVNMANQLSFASLITSVCFILSNTEKIIATYGVIDDTCICYKTLNCIIFIDVVS